MKNLSPHRSRKTQPFMLPSFAVTKMDQQKSPSEATIFRNTIIDVALVWCSALLLANHDGSCEASWGLFSTGVFEAKGQFHMWWLSLIVYLFMTPIHFFPSFSSTVPCDSLVSSGEQTKILRRNLLPVVGVPLFLSVPFFLSHTFFRILS